jgi:hypothetical protein
VQLNQQDGFIPIEHLRCTFQDSFLGCFYINLQDVDFCNPILLDIVVQ